MSNRRERAHVPPMPAPHGGDEGLVVSAAAPRRWSRAWAPVGVGLAAVISCVGFAFHAVRANHGLGFPLDDAWIHLTFARNLAFCGSFSYYPGDPPVAGSTSPLYTGLLAALMRLGRNEYLVSYALGITGFVVACLLFWGLGRREWGDGRMAVVGALLLATQPRLVLIALSGMETTLFIALILGALLAYRAGRPAALGVCLGAAVWCRPDGFVLVVALVGDWLMRSLIDRTWSGPFFPRSMVRAQGIGAAMWIAYGVFNWALSGSPLPTTFGAKGAYYRLTMTKEHFLSHDVTEAFGRHELSFVWIFAVAYLGVIVWRTLEGDPPAGLVHAFFLVGLVCAYLAALPFAHRFGRYLLPALPSFLILALSGIRALASWVRGRTPHPRWLARGVGAVVLAIVVTQWASGLRSFAAVYRVCCAYHASHHVAAARWIAAHTPPDARIATHDIGAIAFYGGRRVVDMVGIVTPEVIAHISAPGFTAYLDEFLSRAGVTHTVTLSDWFVPEHAPLLFVPSWEPEILSVHAFVPGVTHIQFPFVASLIARGATLLNEGRPQEALGFLATALAHDSRSSRALELAGAAHAMRGNDLLAQEALTRSLTLFPHSPLAHYELARLELRRGAREQARAHLRASLTADPSFEPSRLLLREFGETNASGPPSGQ